MKDRETIRLRYGNTNTYLVSGTGGFLLVDTDYAGTMKDFFKAIKEAGVEVKDIAYLLATHYHPDHIGLAGELQEMGVKLLIMDVQVNFVHYADTIYYRDNRSYVPPDLNRARVISCSQSRKFLKKELALDGEILHTPSHSRDSVSLVLDNGECFVGDLEPREYLAAYDADEAAAEKADWAAIMKYRPKTVWYGHALKKTV